jgi:hypothetical protein
MEQDDQIAKIDNSRKIRLPFRVSQNRVKCHEDTLHVKKTLDSILLSSNWPPSSKSMSQSKNHSKSGLGAQSLFKETNYAMACKKQLFSQQTTTLLMSSFCLYLII